jgi:hypothetical protein
MNRFTASEWYAIASVAALLLAAALNRPPLTLALAGVGLVAGAFVARRGPLSRAGIMSMAGFAAAAALAAFTLLR